MQKENRNKKELSFPDLPVRRGLGNLPLSKLLLKEEKLPYLVKQVEDPRQKPSGMTPDFIGFTLIELLVVVLIIGILAAVAVPQYQKAVEKARLTEAITIVRAIANANQVFYMANGRYASRYEIGLLDVEIPGEEKTSGWAKNRIETKYFIYSPAGEASGGADTSVLAVAQRVMPDNAVDIYYLSIAREDPGRVRCTWYPSGHATKIQKKLCEQLDANGTL